MRIQTCMSFVLLLASTVSAVLPMPDIVKQFEVTRALWHTLNNQGLLPGTFVTQDLRTFPAEPWHDFLRANGKAIIDEVYASLFRYNDTWSGHHTRSNGFTNLTFNSAFLCSPLTSCSRNDDTQIENFQQRVST